MILLIFAVLGLILGLVAGGSLRGLARYSIKGLFLPILALAIKSGAAAALTPQTGAVAVCLAQYSLLFLFLLWNHRRPVWPLFVFLGSALNFAVILLNGGCMPVTANLLSSSGDRLTQLTEGKIYAYCLMGATTRLPFLGDVIRLGPVAMPIGFASIGDLLLGVGVAILVFHMAKEEGVRDNRPRESTLIGK